MTPPRFPELLVLVWDGVHRPDSPDDPAPSPAECQLLRRGLNGVLRDGRQFDALFRFYHREGDGGDAPDLPNEVRRRFESGGVDALTDPEVVRVLTTPVWVAELRDAVVAGADVDGQTSALGLVPSSIETDTFTAEQSLIDMTPDSKTATVLPTSLARPTAGNRRRLLVALAASVIAVLGGLAVIQLSKWAAVTTKTPATEPTPPSTSPLPVPKTSDPPPLAQIDNPKGAEPQVIKPYNLAGPGVLLAERTHTIVVDAPAPTAEYEYAWLVIMDPYGDSTARRVKRVGDRFTLKYEWKTAREIGPVVVLVVYSRIDSLVLSPALADYANPHTEQRFASPLGGDELAALVEGYRSHSEGVTVLHSEIRRKLTLPKDAVLSGRGFTQHDSEGGID